MSTLIVVYVNNVISDEISNINSEGKFMNSCSLTTCQYQFFVSVKTVLQPDLETRTVCFGSERIAGHGK